MGKSGAVCAAVVLAVLGAGGFGQAHAPAEPIQVRVTGAEVPEDTVQLAIATTARILLALPPLSQVRVTATRPRLGEVEAASEPSVEAQLTVIPPSGRPLTRVLPVRVTTVVLPWSDAQALFVSNSPETLPYGKVLYAGSLGTGQTVRLLYHHQNGSRHQNMVVRADLSNPTREPLTLWIAAGAGGLGPSELDAGHVAARSFLEQYWRHAGFLLSVPPNTTVPLLVHDLPPGAVASGVVQTSLVDGARLNLEVVARLEGEPDPPPLSFAPDFDVEHQRGAFPRPQIVRSATYTLGGPSASLEVGADRDLLREAQTHVPLQGNYGVTYRFDVTLVNPTLQPGAVALSMHAEGGPARGTFWVDGRVIDGPPVLPSTPQLLTTIHVPPLGRRLVRIATMPESGSNYPVRLTLGPAW